MTLALFLATAAYAAATFGEVEVTNLQTGYLLTVEVSSMSLPDKMVCLEHSVDGVPAAPIPCTCSAPECPAATWQCVIPTNYNSATVDWDVSAWTAGSGGTCGAKATQGPTGAFETIPTAIGLATGTVRGAADRFPGVLFVLLLVVTAAAPLALRRNRR
jgi:hypothetical protein